MRELARLYDSTGNKNYLVYGSYKKLIPYLCFRLGFRNILDKTLLYLLPQSAKSLSVDLKANNIFKVICEHFESLSSIILFNTSWYKDSLYVGIFQSMNEMYFIKCFSSVEETGYQIHSEKFIRQYFSSEFFIIPITTHLNMTLISPFIKKRRNVTNKDAIEKKLLKLTSVFVSQTTTMKSAADIIPIDLSATFLKSGKIKELSAIQTWVSKQDIEFPIVPVHGDFTPWNVFVDKNNLIVLTDYETAGWHVAFYDYFHYILQPKAITMNTDSIHAISFDADHPHIKKLLCLYLIDQLNQHLFSLNKHVQSNKSLNCLIENKSRWLMELLDA